MTDESRSAPRLKSALRAFIYLTFLTILLLQGLTNFGDVAKTTLSRLDGELEAEVPEDFLSFYVAGRFVLDGRSDDLYKPHAVEEMEEALVNRPVGGAEEGLPFFNPPFLAGMMAPLAALSLPAFSLALFAIVLATVVVGGLLAERFLPIASPRQRFLLWFCYLSFLPVTWLLEQQQLTMLVFLGWLGFVYLETKGEHRWSGASLALTLVKPQSVVLLLLILVWKKRWQTLRSFAIAASPLVAMSLLVAGPDVFIDYPRFLIESTRWDGRGVNALGMFSWNGFMANLLGDRSPPLLAYLPLTLASLGVLLATWRNAAWEPHSPKFLGLCAATFLTAMLINPHFYLQDVTLVCVPLVMVIAWRHRGRSDIGIWWFLAFGTWFFGVYGSRIQHDLRIPALTPWLVLLLAATYFEYFRGTTHSKATSFATLWKARHVGASAPPRVAPSALRQKLLRVLACLFLVSMISLEFGTWANVIGARVGQISDPSRATKFEDYAAFYTAGRMILDGEASSLYDTEAIREAEAEILGRPVQAPDDAGVLPFFNPPFFAALMVPLAILPLDVSYAVSFFLICVVIIATGLALTRYLGTKTLLEHATVLAWFVCAPSAILVALQGQLSLLPFLAWLGFVEFQRQGRQAMSASALALALVKPQFVVLAVPFLIWQRQWATLKTFAVICAGLGLVSIVVAGPQVVVEYPRLILQSARWDHEFGIVPESMFGWSGFFQRTLELEGTLHRVIASASVIGTIAFAVYAFRNGWRPLGPDFAPRAGILLAATMLISLHLYRQDMLMMNLILVFGARHAREVTGSWGMWPVLAAGTWLLQYLELNYLFTAGINVQTLALAGLVLALLIDLRRAPARATRPQTESRNHDLLLQRAS